MKQSFAKTLKELRLKSSWENTGKDMVRAKVGKNWKITSFPKVLNNVIHCNYNYAYDDFF